jgi:hypothetical protein
MSSEPGELMQSVLEVMSGSELDAVVRQVKEHIDRVDSVAKV